jgi:hypothetical protein
MSSILFQAVPFTQNSSLSGYKLRSAASNAVEDYRSYARIKNEKSQFELRLSTVRRILYTAPQAFTIAFLFSVGSFFYVSGNLCRLQSLICGQTYYLRFG